MGQTEFPNGVSDECLTRACKLLGNEAWALKVNESDPSGWVVRDMLERNGSVSSEHFLNWWNLESCSEAFQSFMEKQFPGSVLLERHGSHLRFKVPQLGCSLADAFEILENCTKTMGVAEYSASETTLEQIFVMFAKTQKEEQGEVRGFM